MITTTANQDRLTHYTSLDHNQLPQRPFNFLFINITALFIKVLIRITQLLTCQMFFLISLIGNTKEKEHYQVIAILF